MYLGCITTSIVSSLLTWSDPPTATLTHSQWARPSRHLSPPQRVCTYCILSSLACPLLLCVSISPLGHITVSPKPLFAHITLLGSFSGEPSLFCISHHLVISTSGTSPHPGRAPIPNEPPSNHTYLYSLQLVNPEALHQSQDLFIGLARFAVMELDRARHRLFGLPTLHLHPLVLLDLGDRVALLWISDQHPSD